MSESTVKFLEAPLTDEEELDSLEGQEVSYLVSVELETLLVAEFEDCFNIMADSVVDNSSFGFNDFSYIVSGATDDGLLILKLTGIIQRH